MMVRPVAAALLAALPLASAACTSNVPVGFDSGTSAASRDLAASPAEVEAAVRALLVERGDAIETELRGDITTIRTGRHWIRIEPRDGGATFLQIEIARYVGADHQRQVDDLMRAVVERLD